MTAIAPRRSRLNIDWDAIRRDFNAGDRPGVLAARYGLQVNTIYDRIIRHGWHGDAATAVDIQRRMLQIIANTTDVKAPSIRAKLAREFGADHPALPSLEDIRAHFPHVGHQEKPEKLVPIDGLRRRCQADGCFKLTTHDPCHHCGAKHS